MSSGYESSEMQQAKHGLRKSQRKMISKCVFTSVSAASLGSTWGSRRTPCRFVFVNKLRFLEDPFIVA
jgi:hypothetical protein